MSSGGLFPRESAGQQIPNVRFLGPMICRVVKTQRRTQPEVCIPLRSIVSYKRYQPFHKGDLFELELNTKRSKDSYVFRMTRDEVEYFEGQMATHHAGK